MDKAREEKAKRIFRRVLEDIKPSKAEAEEIIANVNRITLRLRKIVPKSVEIKVVGSIARSTNLKGDGDIDIFMLFSKAYKKDRLAALGVEYGKKLVDRKAGERYEIKYAEHPYVRAYFKTGLKADIVPASKIESAEDLATAVDRTPLHTEFINSHFTDAQRDEVRLLKYLLKAHSIYGAEIKTGGFSGYLCELLVHQFGSLAKLMDGVSTLKLPAVLEPGSRKLSIADENLVKKFGRRFIVIDPVDPDRNVAAAVSEESLARLAIISRKFISRPDIELFYGKGFSSSKAGGLLRGFIENSGLDFFLVVLKVPDKSTDVTWPQLRKMSSLAIDFMKRQGFETFLDMSWIDGRNGFLLIASPKLELNSRLMKGPDVFKTKETSAFVDKHKGSMGFVFKNSTIYSLEKSKYPSMEAILKDVADGRIVGKRNDIDFKGAKVFINKIPEEYSYSTYTELRKAVSI